MSSLIVEVCQVDRVELHPNADRLEILSIKGWKVCSQKGAYKQDDKCVYFPPDCVLPPALSDRLGVTKYLHPLSKLPDGTRPSGGRVRVASLRGFRSYGFVSQPDDPSWPVGHDVSVFYGITKWEPPLTTREGDGEAQYPAFHRFYDMENIRHFPGLLNDGEEVFLTEKMHGQNARVGLIKIRDDEGKAIWTWAAGSHNVQRQRFNKDGFETKWWRWLTCPGVKDLLCAVSECGYFPEDVEGSPEVLMHWTGNHDVVLFGEMIGSGVQDMTYGHNSGEISFRAFDISVNGKYLDVDTKLDLFRRFGIASAPVIYRGPYSFAKVDELCEGKTLVCDPALAGKKDFREGVVVTACHERSIATEKKVFERPQLKCVSFTYLNRDAGTEEH